MGDGWLNLLGLVFGPGVGVDFLTPLAQFSIVVELSTGRCRDVAELVVAFLLVLPRGTWRGLPLASASGR